VVPSWLISYSKEEVTATSKSKEQREVAETIEEVNRKKEVPARPSPIIKKEWRPKQVIPASN
jgi:hypothetical protein